MTNWRNFFGEATADELEAYLEEFNRARMFRRHWLRSEVLKLIHNPVWERHGH